MMTDLERAEQLGLTDALFKFMLNRYGKNFPIMSDQLYTMMALEFDSLPEESKSTYLDEFDVVHARMKHVVDEIAAVNPAHKRVELVHRLLDLDSGINASKAEASCRKGCSFCCHVNVDVTHDEAKVLRRLLPDDKDLKRRLRKQAKINDRYNFQYLLPKADSACVFLKDSECSIYNQRPMVCRMFLVKSPPELCDWEKSPDIPTLQFINLKLEVFKTMVFQRFGCDHLPKQLLK